MKITQAQKDLARSPDAGPYMDDGGSEWYFPVDRWSWNLAQAEAKDLAEDSESVAVYMGQKVVELHDHEDWEFGDESCPKGGCPSRRAFHFYYRPRW